MRCRKGEWNGGQDVGYSLLQWRGTRRGRREKGRERMERRMPPRGWPQEDSISSLTHLADASEDGRDTQVCCGRCQHGGGGGNPWQCSVEGEELREGEGFGP
jgi:hypothetical protein